MPSSNPRTGRRVSEAARIAATAARRAKLAEPDHFGVPELFVVKAEASTFAWELRRFGGLVLQRSPKAYASQTTARADGEAALAALCASPDLPTFKRELKWKSAPPASTPT